MIAIYGGYTVNVRTKACHYKIYVKEGVRGFNIPVAAEFCSADGWNITHNGQRLTVERVVTLVDIVNGIYEDEGI